MPVMLSGETAVGKYPRGSADDGAHCDGGRGANLRPLTPEHEPGQRLSIAETICESMAHAARDLNVRAIAIFTETANTARILSKYGRRPIFTTSHSAKQYTIG